MDPHIQSFHEPLRATFFKWAEPLWKEQFSFFFFPRKSVFLPFFSKNRKIKIKESKIKQKHKIKQRQREKKTSNLPVGSESQRAGLVSSFRAVSFIHA